MDKEFFDKILDQVIEEASTMYVENEAKKNIEIDDTEFSELHNQKMKKIFREAKMREVRKNAIRVTKKIAVVVLCTMLITAGLITSVEAWREEFVRFIMKNNDDNYMSIKFGDTTSGESTDIENESCDVIVNEPFIIDDIKFMYLPNNTAFDKKEVFNNFIYYNFICGNDYIRVSKENKMGVYTKESDIENTNNEKIEYKDKEVFKIIKENKEIKYVWYDENNLYTVLATLDENEILKIIENIKILKKF